MGVSGKVGNLRYCDFQMVSPLNQSEGTKTHLTQSQYSNTAQQFILIGSAGKPFESRGTLMLLILNLVFHSRKTFTIL
jgi:hypothetical protein